MRRWAASSRTRVTGRSAESEGGDESGHGEGGHGEEYHKNSFAIFIGSTQAEQHHAERGDALICGTRARGYCEPSEEGSSAPLWRSANGK